MLPFHACQVLTTNAATRCWACSVVKEGGSVTSDLQFQTQARNGIPAPCCCPGGTGVAVTGRRFSQDALRPEWAASQGYGWVQPRCCAKATSQLASLLHLKPQLCQRTSQKLRRRLKFQQQCQKSLPKRVIAAADPCVLHCTTATRWPRCSRQPQ